MERADLPRSPCRSYGNSTNGRHMKKRTRRKVYLLANPIALAIEGAAITDASALDKLRLRELSAVESFRTGKATREDWMSLADMLNICETLAKDGIGPEAMEPLPEGPGRARSGQREARQAWAPSPHRPRTTGPAGCLRVPRPAKTEHQPLAV